MRTDSVEVDTRVDNLTIAADKVGGDGVINAVEQNGGVTITGTTEVGSTSVVVAMGSTTLPATVAGDGTWTVTFPATHIETGTYNAPVSVTATDAAGNTASVTETVRVDTEVVPLTQTKMGGGSDDVVSASEAAMGIDLGGRVEVGSSVVVNFEGTNHTAIVDANGNWALTIPASAIAHGTYDAEVTIHATDAVGNVASISNTLAVDTDAPAGPVIAAYTRDGSGFRGIAVEPETGSDGQPLDGITIEAAQINANGTVNELVTDQHFSAFRGKTNIEFARDVPDGADIIVTNTDAAGNTSGTYLVLDDTLVSANVQLASPALGNFQIEHVDMQFAEEAHLTINEDALVALSTNTNTLMVHGGADDSITITGGVRTGSQQVDGQGYGVYSVGEGTVIVDDDIQII